ncbi:hypothetical protein D3C80_1708800 [compost metagenome]
MLRISKRIQKIRYSILIHQNLLQNQERLLMVEKSRIKVSRRYLQQLQFKQTTLHGTLQQTLPLTNLKLFLSMKEETN